MAAPFTATINIINTSSQQIQLAPLAATMYRGFSNDFASFTVTRLGDTNAASYTVNTFVSAGGTAVLGTDYTAPTNITFNPGDTVYTNIIMPLIGGLPPVHQASPDVYIGNLTAIIGVNAARVTQAVRPHHSPSAWIPAIRRPRCCSPIRWMAPRRWATRTPGRSHSASADWSLPDMNDYEVDFGFIINTDPGNQSLAGLLTNCRAARPRF